MHQMRAYCNSSQNLLTHNKSFYRNISLMFENSLLLSNISTTLLELVVPILISTLSNPAKILWSRYPVWNKSPSKLQLLWEMELRKNCMKRRVPKKKKEHNRLSLDFWGRAIHALTENRMASVMTTERPQWMNDSLFAVRYCTILRRCHASLSHIATQKSCEKEKLAALAKRKGNWNEVIQLWSGEERKIPTTK